MISDWHIFELYQKYSHTAKIDFGTKWICNPAKLDFHPNPQGSRNEDQRHKRWLKFLNTYDSRSLAYRLLKNNHSLDEYQNRNISNGLEFSIEMKGIDKVEQNFLPQIQNNPEMKETYDRLKLREIFELQRNKYLVDDGQCDPKLSSLWGPTFEKNVCYFVKRAKEENLLEILEKICKGKTDNSNLYP